MVSGGTCSKTWAHSVWNWSLPIPVWEYSDGDLNYTSRSPMDPDVWNSMHIDVKDYNFKKDQTYWPFPFNWPSIRFRDGLKLTPAINLTGYWFPFTGREHSICIRTNSVECTLIHHYSPWALTMCLTNTFLAIGSVISIVFERIGNTSSNVAGTDLAGPSQATSPMADFQRTGVKTLVIEKCPPSASDKSYWLCICRRSAGKKNI